MSNNMTPVFYTRIRPAHGQTTVEVIRRAHALGYELVPFNGWTNAEIGASGNHGSAWTASRENLKRCGEIQDACIVRTDSGADWPHIIQQADGHNDHQP